MEVEEDKIGMVLVRASELRSKISNSLHKLADDDDDDDEQQEEAETLLNICDAFDSLESHLASLQTLQQQQQYDREALISEIEYSRKILLKKLNEYKGEHLDVIEEAEAFASMKVEHNNELLLPPYFNRATTSLVLENGQLSRIPYALNFTQNGQNGSDLTNEGKMGVNDSSKSQARLTFWKGLRSLLGTTVKASVTFVGVISILTLAGFEPRFVKKRTNFRVLSLFHQPERKERRLADVECPPGKVAVIEDGEIRCLVKERVEIPFDSIAAKTDVNLGCG